MWIYFGIYIWQLVIITVIVTFLLRKYWAPEISLFVRTLVLIGWVIGFSVVALTPFDIYISWLDDPRLNHPEIEKIDKILKYNWNIFYWTSQVLWWLIFPFMQTYLMRGEFTVFGKLWNFSLILFGIQIIVGGLALLLIYYLINLTRNENDQIEFKELIYILSCLYGQLLIVFLMSYGLVSIPRNLWNNSNYNSLMRHYLYRISKYDEEIADCKNLICKLYCTLSTLNVDDKIKKYLEIVYQEAYDLRKMIESDSFKTPRQTWVMSKYGTMQNNSSSIWSEYNEKPINIKSLIEIRSKLINLKMKYIRSQSAFNKTMIQWIQKDKLIQRLNIEYNEEITNSWLSRTGYYYYFYIRPVLMKLFAVLTGLCSLIIIFTEFTHFIHSDFNIFRNLIIDEENYFISFLVTFPRLLYSCLWTYYGLFRFNIFGVYRMQYNSSDAISLIYSATMLARLIYPLSYNFLYILNLRDTNFEEIMQILNSFTLLSGVIEKYVFPVMIVVVWLWTLFRVVAWVLSLVGLSRYEFDRQETELRIEEGKLIINDEKNSTFCKLKECHENEKSQSLLNQKEINEESRDKIVNLNQSVSPPKNSSLLYNESLYSSFNNSIKNSKEDSKSKLQYVYTEKRVIENSIIDNTICSKPIEVTIKITDPANFTRWESNKTIYLSSKHEIFKEI